MKLRKPTQLLLKDTLKCMLFSSIILFALFGVTRLVNIGAFDLYRLAFKEFSFLDTYYAQKMSPEIENLNQQLVLVNVGNKSREELALALDKIQEQKPKVIGVDIIFDVEKEKAIDLFLEKQLQAPNIISAYAIKSRNLIKNSPKIGVFRHKLGYANFNFDKYNSVIRNFQAKKIIDDFTYTSFGLRVAQSYWGLQKKIDWKNMESNSIPINYNGGLERYFSLDVDDVMRLDSIPLMRNSIVLMGYLGTPLGNSNDIEDKHFTPLNQEFMAKSAPDTFGVVIHANIIEMLINENELRILPNWALILIGFILTFIAVAYFIKLNKRHIERYMLVRKLVQLGFTILFIWVALWLLSNNIYLKITELIWYTVLTIECIWAYKILSNYLKNKYGWKSYFFHDC